MRPEHAAELFVWMREPALYRFLSQTPPPDVVALAANLRRWTGGAPDPRERWWNWCVRTIDVAGEPIVGHVQLTFTCEAEVLVAWVFAPLGRGRGLATEASRVALAFAASDDRERATVVATIDEPNLASIAVAGRLGLRRSGDLGRGELRFEGPLAAFAGGPHAAPEDLRLRLASESDRATLRAFSRAMWLEVGTPEDGFHDDWERRFDAGSDLLTARGLRSFVAERNGVPVGSASVHVYENPSPALAKRRVAYVWGAYVVPAARGRGIARSLMEACLAAARELGCTRAVLHASKAGRRTYERLGFRASNEMLLELE